MLNVSYMRKINVFTMKFYELTDLLLVFNIEINSTLKKRHIERMQSIFIYHYALS